MLEAAKTWYGRDLDFMGIDLGDCLVYPVLENIVIALKRDAGLV